MDNYNVNRKVVNFKDFSGDTEKEELQKVRRSTKPNSEDQQHIGNSRYKFNKVTRKMDDLSPEMIDDKIEAIDELEETNEEYFGGASGIAIITLEGKGDVKDYVEKYIKEALKNVGGEIHLLVDGEEVDIN